MVREILQQLADDNDGELTPELVVSEAKAPDHPLHGRFEWDDSKAGARWRRHQASELIRSVKIQYREATATESAQLVNGFVNTVSASGERVYRPVEDVANDEFASALVLREAERQWRALHRRYGHLAEFVRIVRGDVEDEAV